MPSSLSPALPAPAEQIANDFSAGFLLTRVHMVAPAPSPVITPPLAETIGDISNNVAGSPPRLTRSQVADRLDVSISTVRRLEGLRLHPEIGPGNTRLFDPTEVAVVAASLRRSAEPAAEPKPSATSRGELAARIFERFEQRHSLSEIVIELRVAPDLVRELYHQWRVGLDQGEARRKDSAVSTLETPSVSEEELRQLLARLPSDRPTRISVARVLDEPVAGGNSRVEVFELGGFVANGPLDISEIVNRYGWDRFRITAASHAAVSWEVLTPFL